MYTPVEGHDILQQQLLPENDACGPEYLAKKVDGSQTSADHIDAIRPYAVYGDICCDGDGR